MFCPNCGTRNDVQQSFCRTCGLELKEVLQGLSKIEGLNLVDSDWLRKLGIFTIGGLAALLICLLTIAVFSSLQLNIGAAFIFMMILFGITLGFLSITLVDKYQLKKAQNGKNDEKNYLSPRQIERWNTNKQLNESTFEPIPSVTESTTELFYVEKMKPKTSGELG